MNKQALIKKCVSKLNPIDDLMFRKMAEEKEFCEEMLRTILGDPQLIVLENQAQWYGTNLQGRSIIVDVKCILGDGRHVNVEVQKSNKDDHERRVRYHGAILTTNISDTGTDFKEVPDVCVIYIASFGIFKDVDPKNPIVCFHVDRVVRETGEVVYNGFEEIYINANARDESEISDLMAIFMEENTYDRERFPKTSESKKRYKEGEGKMMNEEVNAIIRQIVDYEVAEQVEKQVAEKSAEMEKQMAAEMEEQVAIKSAEMEKQATAKFAEMEERMAKKEADYQAERAKEQAKEQAERAKDQAEIARLKAALQEALSQLPQ